MDMCVQLNWSFGTRDQSILSHSINTYYKSVWYHYTLEPQAFKSSFVIKQQNTLQYVSLLAIIEYSGSNFEMKRKKKVPVTPFIFSLWNQTDIQQSCYTLTFPKYIIHTKERIKNKNEFTEIQT